MLIDITTAGASPEIADNAAIIQSIFDSAKPGDVVYVPRVSGIFFVDAQKSVRPKSGTSLQVDGVLRATPNNVDVSSVVRIEDVEDVSVFGTGSIVGERGAGDAGVPELSHGHGIDVRRSKRISITQVRTSGCKGDGVYLEGNVDVVVEGISSTGNKRNAISLISGVRNKISNSLLGFTDGPAPMPNAGLDIEPDHQDQVLYDITVSGNKFVKNKGAGIYRAFDDNDSHSRIFVTGNDFDQHFKDGVGPPVRGHDPWLAWLGYALFRWVPGYDWWWFKREFTVL